MALKASNAAGPCPDCFREDLSISNIRKYGIRVRHTFTDTPLRQIWRTMEVKMKRHVN